MLPLPRRAVLHQPLLFYRSTAEKYDAASLASMRLVRLGESPEWLDIVHDYYRILRAQK